MQSELKTFSYPDGEVQRVQLVRLDSWEQLDFLRPEPCEEALGCFADIYRQYLVPACPWIFGNMIMFRLPADVEMPFECSSKKLGEVGDALTAAAAALQSGVRIVRGKPKFKNEQLKEFWNVLERSGSVRIVSGKLPTTKVIPVGNAPGYMSRTQENAALKVNSSFFIMDMFDCATLYDHVGTPFGLCVKDGEVKNPPLFGREALIVKKDGVSIKTPSVRELTLEINGQVYRHGENAEIFSRPEYAKSPSRKGRKLVIIGQRVAAVCDAARVSVPASGFVMCTGEKCSANPGDKVTYRGMEDVVFGIQVGNSIVINGEKTEKFISRFYNLRGADRVAYPPSLYPLDFEGARAARIALGADSEGRPMLLWAEGAGKFGYKHGEESCGASLSEMAEICSSLGMVNAVNLDGGGSAQILMNNRRSLLISDRNRADNTEAERPVPLGLIMK
ncbi:MAG: phosphodiester glycosidase family protein [Oscillospiraceae bacterium]|nr:phosphodiester glycosidase family protein [Oscillospiraceae bacterium]